MNDLSMEVNTEKTAFGPVSLVGAQTGARIGLKEGSRCKITIDVAAGIGGVIIPSLDQHDAPTAGNSKALNIKANVYWKAIGQTEFTKVEIRPDDTVLSDSIDLSAEITTTGGLIVLEVLASHLDVEGDFDHISVNMAAAGGITLVSAVMQLRDTDHKPAYALTV